MRARLGVALLGTALVFGCDGPTSADRGVRGRVEFRVAPAAVIAGQPSPEVWAISRVRLLVSPAGSAATTLTRPVAPLQTAVEFPVVVPAGTTRFRAEVVSNRDTVLYDGETTQEVTQDGFTATLALQRRRPAIALGPDTVSLTSVTSVPSATVVLFNRGAGVLTWRVDSSAVSTALSACGGPCVAVNPPRSFLILENGAEAVVIVRRTQTPASTRSVVLRFTSAQGYVDLVVLLGP